MTTPAAPAARSVPPAAGAFFCVLGAYFLVRPWREAMGLEGGVDDLSLLFLATAGVMLAVQPLYGVLVNRVRRTRLAPAIFAGSALCLAAFAIVPRLTGTGRLEGETLLLVGRVFYVWLSVFNLLAVSVFWQVMADTHRLDASKRRFGPIALGGTVGAIAGSAVTARYAEALGPSASFLIAAALMLAAAGLMVAYARVAIEREPEAATHSPPWQGLVDIARRPYLLGVVAYLAVLPLLSTFWYFTKMGLVASALPEMAQRAAFFSRVELAAQTLTLIVQALVLGPVLRRLGTGVALAALPVTFAIGFAALGLGAELVPALALIAFLDIGRRVGNNGLAKPARDTLFTVVPRDQRYKAKNALDTFIYRAVDALGALAWRGGVGALATPALAGLAVALCAGWTLAGLWLGRTQARLAQAEPAQGHGRDAHAHPAREEVGAVVSGAPRG